MQTDFKQGDSNNQDEEASAIGGMVVTPDGQQIQLSQEDAQTILDAKEAADKKKQALVEELVIKLIDKREAVVRSRRDIERRWIDDQRQWDGESRLLNTKEFPSQTNDDNMKPPRPHLTRSRCDLWEARMIDLLVPTIDPTWELDPLTNEDLNPPSGMDVQTWVQQLQAIKDDMEKRAEKMRDVIKDQLSACNATKALRKMCRDACRMGTGIVMGPMNGTHVRRKYNKNDPTNPVKVSVEESIIPELREGDPWCFYPDMTESADRAEYAFYLHSMSETDLWNFSDFPGVNKEEVLELMDEKPDYGEVETAMKERNQYSGLKESIENRHAVWRYTGIIDRKYCEALDIDTEDGPVCADIWFCNKHILKSKLTMLSSVKDFRIPYYVFSPFPIDDTMFGGSIAYLCRDSQRTADASWLIGLHNLSVSSGPQIIIRKGKVVPADGKYSIRGPKVWYVTDDAVNPGDVFDSVNIENNAAQAFQCFDMSKQLMDEELNTVQWASPDTSDVTQTASGLAMLMNARTILQRRVCACADDDVFQPLITRFVLWNILYNKREDIKGDYDVRPLCQSVRLVKDIRIQQKLFVADNLAANPMFQGIFNPYDMLSDITRDLDVQVDSWMKPKEQWMQEQKQAAQAAQQNPAEAATQQTTQLNQQLLLAKTHTEQIKQQKMQSDILKTPSQAQVDQSGQQSQFLTPQDQLALQKHSMDKQVELQRVNSDLAGRQLDAQTSQTVAAMNLQAKREGIAADIHKAAQRNTHDLIKTGVNARMKVESMKTAFPRGTVAPKAPTGKFTPPKVPQYHRGKG